MGSAADVAIILTTADGRIESVNDRAVELLAASRKYLQGQFLPVYFIMGRSEIIVACQRAALGWPMSEIQAMVRPRERRAVLVTVSLHLTDEGIRWEIVPSHLAAA
jgi:PAS domain-containing protein